MTARDLAAARAYARAGFGACTTPAERKALVGELGALADGELRPTPPSVSATEAAERLGGAARRALLARESWHSRVSALTLHLIEALASRNDLHLLRAVRVHCESLLRRSEGRLCVTAAFAAEPDPGTVTRLRQQLVPADTPCDFRVCVQPGLLGGFTVQIDDRLVDASLAGRLARLRFALVQTPANPMESQP